MNDEHREFEKQAVMLLFKRIREGRAILNDARVPNLKAALEAVRFDSNGEPVMDSVGPPVRSVAMTMANVELDRFQDALEKTGDRMGVDALLPKETDVSDSVLGKCESEADFTRLAFELFKEAAGLTLVVSCAYNAELPSKFPWERPQAVCAGLLIRAVKFMLAVGRLHASGDFGEFGEVNLALWRCIMEAAVNVRFLLKKDSPQLFDDFVRFSFIAERKLHEEIQENISARGGTMLPIEQRMLDSINRCLSDSGITIDKVPEKGRIEEIVGNLRQRLEALGIAERYTGHQRMPSHAIHGDWVDLVLFHLTHENGCFGPKTDFCADEPGTFLPVSVVVLEATIDYLQHFYPNSASSAMLLHRAEGLRERIAKVMEAHETHLSRNSSARPPNSPTPNSPSLR